MKTKLHFLFIGLALLAGVHEAAGLPATNSPAAIPWNQIGAKTGADYKGDGLAVTPIGGGAHLRCVFQRLEGEATLEGLRLTSTLTNAVQDRFRVVAVAVGRVADGALNLSREERVAERQGEGQLPRIGTVSVSGQTVRFSRPGLVEEYSVSMDGVRQDFLVPERPAGKGEVTVRLAVSGARVEAAAAGARLVLDHSGRKLAYSRLRATDATGRELAARMEIESTLENSRPKAGTCQSLLTSATSSEKPDSALVVVVNDAAAVYPVRIDPTFSDADWIGLGDITGPNADPYTLVVDASGNLYIGGDFTAVGEVTASGIAKWDGTNWSAVGSGFGGSNPFVVNALAVSGSDVYAGGYFTNAGGVAANYIAKWDGSSWSALGSGMNGEVYALAVSGSNLYVGGFFTTAGGVAATNIAEWNGSSWSALGSGLNNGVGALAVSGSNLYAGGRFTTAGGVAATNIAEWNGSSWSALGSGMNGVVYVIALSGSDLYAGGNFSAAGGVAANGIAKWDGSSWSALGWSGEFVVALTVSESDVYAGDPNGLIAKWDGSGWSFFGEVTKPYDDDGIIWAMASSGSNVYVGGEFTAVNDTTGYSASAVANNVAEWDGSSWSGIGTGVTAPVHALAVSGSDLYVGGQFVTVGVVGGDYVAKWDGSSWSALGSGMNGEVYTLAVSGGTLYAGGAFTTAGGSTANYIAQWNGSSWSALGSGMNKEVFALAVSGTTLYAGGDFTNAGGNAANDIAQWNGSSWSALGSGMNESVSALAVSGGTLYAGGDFSTAGGVAANGIAKWDGSSWSALGSGMNAYVYALAVSGSNLYAGGYFTTAGGVAATNIAKWNGSSWSGLGSGIPRIYSILTLSPGVNALAVSGSDLYAGGIFTTAGGVAANYIAKWDGTNWSALGSGLSSYVYALAVSGTGSDLYVGGQFQPYVARAILRLPSLTLWQTNSGSVAVSWPSPSPGFVLQQNTAGLGSGNWSNVADSILDDGTNKMITQPMGTNRFFRLVLP